MKKRIVFVASIFAVVVTGYLLLKTLSNWNINLHVKSSNTFQANCTLLFENDKEEIYRVLEANKARKTEFHYHEANDCSWLIKEFDKQVYVSEVELQFPLAFALNVYNAPHQVIRFLKVIYRKHNVYCIHYDQKSNPKFKQLILQMTLCLPNVVVPSIIENVIWGWHTIVDAQLHCLEKLLEVRNQYPWMYVMTLCGKEVPLRTNREMVQSLSKLNGTQAIELLSNVDQWRFKFRYILQNGAIVRTNEELGSIPYNLTMRKSWAYMGLTEPFAKFLLQNEMAINFRKFMEQTRIPDEQYIATLFTAPGVPGGYDVKYASLVPTIDDYIWMVEENVPCSGIKVRHVCILNSGDLHRLKYKPVPNVRDAFFHNKFYMEKDETVMDCMEEELDRRNIIEFLEDYPQSRITSMS